MISFTTGSQSWRSCVLPPGTSAEADDYLDDRRVPSDYVLDLVHLGSENSPNHTKWLAFCELSFKQCIF